MRKDSTSFLINVLKSAGKDDFDTYEKEYLTSNVSFTQFMDEIIDEKKMKRQDIFQRADISQKYGYKLLTGESHTTDRDKMLRIFIAMGMTLKQVQRGLELYGLPPLYPKNRRDAIIIICINQGVHSVDEVNEWLVERKEEPFSHSDL